MSGTNTNKNALISDIRKAVINNKANACPMSVRVAWHASGTFDVTDGSGGSNGATTRFEPESTDEANKGLSIIRDMLSPLAEKHGVSQADLWTLAGAAAIGFCGGPEIPHKFGRSDSTFANAHVPPNGRIPDATQGAQHLREHFYRMGMTDRDIVALSGAHTLGRCHLVRSGFDGRWTSDPLTFNNAYFINLMTLDWRKKIWSGKPQFEAIDMRGETVIMLPTDMCLRTDPVFVKYVELYAADEEAFFTDFTSAFSKLLSQGCPAQCDPSRSSVVKIENDKKEYLALEFLEWSMHGSLEHVQRCAKAGANVNTIEKSSGRTALHKAAFWGHVHLIDFLIFDCNINVNAIDSDGDTALHDACRFGHSSVCQKIIAAHANIYMKNKAGNTPLDIVQVNGATKFGVEKDWFITIEKMLIQKSEGKSKL